MENLRFNPPVIAHRGVSALAPENTMAALGLVTGSGAKWVEFDVHLTQDGAPVLLHDDTLERTTNGKGAIAGMDWAEVSQLDAGGKFDQHYAGERVPQLGEALRFLLQRDLRPVIEIKPCPGRARATTMVTLMEAAKIWPVNHPPPLVISFEAEAVGIASQFQPHWPRGLSFDAWVDDWREKAAKVSADALVVNHRFLSRARVSVMAQAGLPLLAYTVNDPAQAKELLGWGVTAVFSDDPGKLAKAP